MNALEKYPLSLDTQAILLLCGQLGKKSEKSEMQPLTHSEYIWLDHWLAVHHLRPAELLETSIAIKLKHLEGHEKVTPSRLLTLLMRKPAMMGALEAWIKKGVWVISGYDHAYPHHLKARLGQWAPPLFYGVGYAPLLQKGGIGLVGPHDVEKSHIELTKKLAKWSAQQNMTVMSNGARGIETEALLTALAQGRCAVGILSDHLLRTMMSNKYRSALQEERLALISPFGPETVALNSPLHHRCLYGLADVIAIIKNLHEEEEAWVIAAENLKMKWTSLFVYQDESLSSGNLKLLEQGAIPIGKTVCYSSTELRNLLFENKHETKNSIDTQSTPLLVTDRKLSIVQEEPKQEETTKGNPFELNKEKVTPCEREKTTDLFDIVWPYIERQLSRERTEEELANCLNIHPKQLKIWLQRAVDLGQIIRLNKPTRYVSLPCYQSKHPSLF